MRCVRIFYLSAAILGVVFLLNGYTIYYLTTSDGRPTRSDVLSVGMTLDYGADVQTPSPVIAVEAAGSFDERVERFNVELDTIRRQIWDRRGFDDWRHDVYSRPELELLWGGRDDYLDMLATKYPHVTTVVLPWVSTGDRVWNSLTDTANLPRQVQHWE